MKYKGLILALLSLLYISLTPKTLATQSVPSTYQLTWPGILPDHPLYKLKQLRNKLIVRLVCNPVELMSFYLRETDKGIYAAKLLVDKGKIYIAKDTALKAENNYTLLVTQYTKLFWAGAQIPVDLDRKIKSAPFAHQKVLQDIIEVVPRDDKLVFSEVMEFSKRNEKAIMMLENYKR